MEFWCFFLFISVVIDSSLVNTSVFPVAFPVAFKDNQVHFNYIAPIDNRSHLVMFNKESRSKPNTSIIKSLVIN